MINPELDPIKQILTEQTEEEDRMGLRTNMPIPSILDLREFMQLVRCALFPDFFSGKSKYVHSRERSVEDYIDKIYENLRTQIARGLIFCNDYSDDVSDLADSLALKFVFRLPHIKHLLLTDIEAVTHHDPAVDNYGEVVLSYPGIQVMLHHRTAHELYVLGVPLIPRILMEEAHSVTGIDIHPAAQIGEYFAIDHGTGIVIGQTTIIGNHCMLYQGVTLGAKNFTYDENGLPLDTLRHPILEDNVTVYSNSSILGRLTIGHDSVIGGNIWIDTDIPPYSVITQAKPIPKSDETEKDVNETD